MDHRHDIASISDALTAYALNIDSGEGEALFMLLKELNSKLNAPLALKTTCNMTANLQMDFTIPDVTAELDAFGMFIAPPEWRKIVEDAVSQALHNVGATDVTIYDFAMDANL